MRTRVRCENMMATSGALQRLASLSQPPPLLPLAQLLGDLAVSDPIRSSQKLQLPQPGTEVAKASLSGQRSPAAGPFELRPSGPGQPADMVTPRLVLGSPGDHRPVRMQLQVLSSDIFHNSSVLVRVSLVVKSLPQHEEEQLDQDQAEQQAISAANVLGSMAGDQEAGLHRGQAEHGVPAEGLETAVSPSTAAVSLPTVMEHSREDTSSTTSPTEAAHRPIGLASSQELPPGANSADAGSGKMEPSAFASMAVATGVERVDNKADTPQVQQAHDGSSEDDMPAAIKQVELQIAASLESSHASSRGSTGVKGVKSLPRREMEHESGFGEMAGNALALEGHCNSQALGQDSDCFSSREEERTASDNAPLPDSEAPASSSDGTQGPAASSSANAQESGGSGSSSACLISTSQQQPHDAEVSTGQHKSLTASVQGTSDVFAQAAEKTAFSSSSGKTGPQERDRDDVGKDQADWEHVTLGSDKGDVPAEHSRHQESTSMPDRTVNVNSHPAAAEAVGSLSPAIKGLSPSEVVSREGLPRNFTPESSSSGNSGMYPDEATLHSPGAAASGSSDERPVKPGQHAALQASGVGWSQIGKKSGRLAAMAGDSLRKGLVHAARQSTWREGGGQPPLAEKPQEHASLSARRPTTPQRDQHASSTTSAASNFLQTLKARGEQSLHAARSVLSPEAAASRPDRPSSDGGDAADVSRGAHDHASIGPAMRGMFSDFKRTMERVGEPFLHTCIHNIQSWADD